MSNPTNSSPSQLPSLVIDLKKNRIRIHKKTLHLLDNPDYIQILVNPSTATIALRHCSAKDYRAERIKWSVVSTKQCCEFYSKYLIKSLRGVFFAWEDDRCYHIDGQLIETERLAKFCMSDSVLLDAGNEREV